MARIGRPPHVELAAGMCVGDWLLLKPQMKKRMHWLCKCACGIERAVVAYDLTGARSRCCGQHPEGAIPRRSLATPAVNSIFSLGEPSWDGTTVSRT